jgi:signal transduction histidine kinase/CheY-like chemotaxis protein
MATTTIGPPPPVLLVDDRPANLVALEATLAPLALRMVTASSGPEALRRLLEDEFAVILLDVQMPGMDGFETAALIKKHPRTAHTPIIFVTAIHRDSAHVFKGYEQGGVDYLLKPFDPTILRSKVQVFVELYRKEKKLKEQEVLLRERERQDLERRNEQQSQAVLDSMPLCVWTLRPDGTPSYRNLSCIKYAGDAAAAGPFSGEPLVHPDDASDVAKLWAGALRRREPLEVEYRLRHADDGEYRWHVGRVVPLCGPGDGTPLTGWIATATDISRQKRAEEDYARLVVEERRAREEAQGANRAKDQFLATLSHELRTPLNAMIGWTRMLRTREMPPEKTRKALETIERNARMQAELIEDILDVSRIITGKLRIEIKPVDLPTIVEAAIDAVRPAAEAKGITLARETDQAPSTFAADPARLQQVIWNLLSNAIKFTPAGGHVALRVGGDGDGEVVIAVTDTGRGISPEFKPYVFDRFSQVDSTSRRAHGGLGLGLAIVRHLVELHGGTVSCDSPGEGQGATFTVRMPRRPPDVQARAITGDPPRSESSAPLDDAGVTLSGVSVLLVDDEPDARELLTEVLEHYGARVTTTASADEALPLLERERPNVLLSDIGLPGQDGYTLIGRVRALPPERGGLTPAAAITAYARSDDAQRALGAGYQRHAPKPIQPAMLARLVKELAAAADASDHDAPGAGAAAAGL